MKSSKQSVNMGIALAVQIVSTAARLLGEIARRKIIMNDRKIVDVNRENWFDYLARGVCAVKLNGYCAAVRDLLLLSKDPPRLGLMITEGQSLLKSLKRGSHFELVILSLSQKIIARSLLGDKELPTKSSSFICDCLRHLSNEESVAVIECQKLECSDVGDQTILIASVLDTVVNPTKAPIINYENELVGLD
jgi:hypothetical protein